MQLHVSAGLFNLMRYPFNVSVIYTAFFILSVQGTNSKTLWNKIKLVLKSQHFYPAQAQHKKCDVYSKKKLKKLESELFPQIKKKKK
jgi:hypothetical protein